ncbi:MAG TPA: histidine phosphatase family protein [Acidimicrobiales bacterium]|nr:histidine phosphatase family protein [Acidimicrobiales bacterium]
MPPDRPKIVHLTLVRHGQSTWNDSAIVQGQRDDAHLTELGRQQAREAGLELRQFDFDAIIASDLARTQETASIIADELSMRVESTPALRERCFGVAEGQPIAELRASDSGIVGGVVVDASAHPEGGESLNDVYERTTSFVQRLAAERNNQRLLLVTHGGAIRTIRALGAGATMDGLAWDPVGNCSIWTVDIEIH